MYNNVTSKPFPIKRSKLLADVFFDWRKDVVNLCQEWSANPANQTLARFLSAHLFHPVIREAWIAAGLIEIVD